MTHAKKNNRESTDGDASSSSDDDTDKRTTGSMSMQEAPDDREENPPSDSEAIVHETGIEGRKERMEAYLRGSGVVYRAMHLLEEWKYMTARISSTKVPVDIIALRKDVVLLVQVFSSRRPLPDAKTVLRHYAEKVGSLRSMGTAVQFRKMLLAYSRRCGWKYFEVLPSRLIPVWNVPAVPDS